MPEQSKLPYPLLEYDTIRQLIEHFAKTLNERKFYSEEDVTRIADQKIAVIAYATGKEWREHIQYLRKQLTRIEERLKESRLGLTATVREIRTVRQLQVELLKYYEIFVDSYNDYLVNKNLLIMSQQRLKSVMKNKSQRVALSGINKKIWTQGKKEAVVYCLKIYDKDNTKQPKEICKDFMNQWIIKGAESYTVDKFLNYFSKMKQNRRAPNI